VVLVLMMMICHVVTMTVFAIDLYDKGDKKRYLAGLGMQCRFSDQLN